jgi:molecular chaperone GrpE
VIHDRRRIDPETGEVRPVPQPGPVTEQVLAEPAVPVGAAGPEAPSQEAELKAQLDERTADVQRLQAEYANYRKRVDRDREVVVNTAKASVVQEMLSVLDDIERAHQHGDLTGAFKAVADKLVATLDRVGLESFGHDGEEFDPAVHEAVQHDTSPDVTGPTVTAVLRRGYKFGDRIVRAALVGVTDHEPAAAAVPEAAAAPVTPATTVPDGQESGDWFAPTDDESPAGRANDQI